MSKIILLIILFWTCVYALPVSRNENVSSIPLDTVIINQNVPIQTGKSKRDSIPFTILQPDVTSDNPQIIEDEKLKLELENPQASETDSDSENHASESPNSTVDTKSKEEQSENTTPVPSEASPQITDNNSGEEADVQSSEDEVADNSEEVDDNSEVDDDDDDDSENIENSSRRKRHS